MPDWVKKLMPDVANKPYGEQHGTRKKSEKERVKAMNTMTPDGWEAQVGSGVLGRASCGRKLFLDLLTETAM